MRIEQQFLIDSASEILSSGDKLSEFELITRLKSSPWNIFPVDTFQNNLALFQIHFVLFHCLYRLQKSWLEEQTGYLKISALHIQKCPLERNKLEDTGEQKIRDYYLNWQNFQDTTEQDVDSLLDSFWQKFGSIGYWQAPDKKEVSMAFAHFNLSETCDWKTMRRAYLKAQSCSHPDKGGVQDDAKENSKQFDILKRYFKSQGEL